MLPFVSPMLLALTLKMRKVHPGVFCTQMHCVLISFRNCYFTYLKRLACYIYIWSSLYLDIKCRKVSYLHLVRFQQKKCLFSVKAWYIEVHVHMTVLKIGCRSLSFWVHLTSFNDFGNFYNHFILFRNIL